MAGRTHKSHGQPVADINITPLVDVMLVLLVIFIVLAPLFSQALRVELPAADAPPLAEPVVVEVTLAADGALAVDGTSVPLEQIPRAISQALDEQPDAVIRLDADQAVRYARVAETISAIQAGGGERLAFATQASSDNTPPE
ncbi:MAG: biopolymer transporter ExbD [Pseudomonadota bacterium]|nr:biopolymer transporter ExbD [Pseudomonadota bacterium]